MSDTPNIVKVVVSKGIIEVIDNNKTSNNVTIVQSDTGVSVVNQQPTVVTTVPRDKAVVTTETTKTSVVEIIEPGPQGVKGETGSSGSAGSSGNIGPRGPRGTGIVVLGVTSSLYVSSSTYDSGQLENIESGSWWILSDTNNFGNGISGSANDGLLYRGLPWINTGPIRGDQGPSGSAGVYVNDVAYNAGTGMVTFELSDGNSLPSIGSINGQDGENGIDGDPGIGIDDIYISDYNLYVRLSDEAAASSLGYIRGPQGPEGPQGLEGDQGNPGNDGGTGGTGSSAYDLWLGQGNAGTQAQFIQYLTGSQGEQGEPGLPGDSSVVESGVLSADLTCSMWVDYDTPFSVGYIENGDIFPSGSAIETILRAMLSQSRPPEPSTLILSSINNDGSSIGVGYGNMVEIGTSRAIDGVTFATTGNVTIGGIYTTGLDPNIGSVASPLDVGDSSPDTFTEQTLVKSTPGSAKVYLTSTATNEYKILYWGAYNYVGGYNVEYNDQMTSANAQTLVDALESQHKTLDVNKSWSGQGSSETATSGYYTYIVYPSTYGDITDIISPTGNTLQSAASPTFTKIGSELPITNYADTADFTYPVNVYISAEDQQLSATDVITIT